MTEEIEVPLEHVQEELQHHALHGGGGGGGHAQMSQSWVTWGALLSAFLAVLAAVAALLSGHHANEGMLSQVRASDQWSYYQAKGIKGSLLETRRDLLQSLGKPAPEKIGEKLAEYQKQQDETREKAHQLEEEAERHMALHETLAKAVTFFQIAIAITAIAVLARRKAFLGVACVFGAVGFVFLVLGTLVH
jgi:hypothetical protein